MSLLFCSRLGLFPRGGNILCRLAVLILIFPVLSWPAAWSHGSAAAQPTDLSQLPISFPIHAPEVAAYFDEMARPGDLASFLPDRLFLLSQTDPSAKMIAFRSWTDAQSQLDGLIGSVAWVMYNPEHWEFTPEDEQQDLATIVQDFARAVHDRDMRFMFTPDRQYAELYLSQVAPHIDAVMLQGQRLQHDPETFATWVLGMAEVAYKANEDIQVYVQVGATRGTAEEMYTAIETVAGEIDGIAVWSMPRTLEILQEFVTLVRGDLPEATATPEATAGPSVVPSDTPTVPVPTEIPTIPAPSPMPTAAPAVEVSPASQNVPPTVEIEASPPVPTEPPDSPVGLTIPIGDWVTSILLFVGGVGVGLVLGFVLGWSLRRGS